MQWTTGDAARATYGQTTPSALCAAFGSDVGGLHAQVDRTRQVLFRNFPHRLEAMLRKAINVRPEKWGNLKPAREHSSRNA
ncbi:MAG: hypothetical protein C0483_01530 [Pirellula sp.]|nr:hypothetical protein [Pirellula sp.]